MIIQFHCSPFLLGMQQRQILSLPLRLQHYWQCHPPPHPTNTLIWLFYRAGCMSLVSSPSLKPLLRSRIFLPWVMAIAAPSHSLLPLKQSFTCTVWITYFSYLESSKDSGHLSSLNSWPHFSTLFTGHLSHTRLTHASRCWVNPLISLLRPPHSIFFHSLNRLCWAYMSYAENILKTRPSPLSSALSSLLNSNSKLLDLSGSHDISGHKCIWFSLYVQTHLAGLTLLIGTFWFYLTSLGIINIGVLIVVLYFLLFDKIVCNWKNVLEAIEHVQGEAYKYY